MRRHAAHLPICLTVTLGVLGAVSHATAADNPMGYHVLAASEAASLPQNHGALGMDLERAQQITDDGITFDIMRVKQVRPRSPGAQAGFNVGDQIIAVDGRVFPSLAIFAAYVGSIEPGRRILVDTIPAGGGPKQAQRIAVTVGQGGRAMPPASDARSGSGAGGLTTGQKVAIGVGAAALFGCYEMGCFTHHSSVPPHPASPPGPGTPASPIPH